MSLTHVSRALGNHSTFLAPADHVFPTDIGQIISIGRNRIPNCCRIRLSPAINRADFAKFLGVVQQTFFVGLYTVFRLYNAYQERGLRPSLQNTRYVRTTEF
jgi:hypothetical protein